MIKNHVLDRLCTHLENIRFYINYTDFEHPHWNIVDWHDPPRLEIDSDRFLLDLKSEILDNIEGNHLTEKTLSDYSYFVINKLRKSLESLVQKRPRQEDFPYVLDHGDEVVLSKDPYQIIPMNITDRESLFNFYWHESYKSSIRTNEWYISEIEKYFDGFLAPDQVSPSGYSLYIPTMKAKYLQLACVALYNYCQDKPFVVQRKQIAQILASIFRRSELDFFSPGKIERPDTMRFEENDLVQVATFFYAIGNILDDEIRRNPANGYFSKG